MSAPNSSAQVALSDNPATSYQIAKRFKNKRNLHVYLTKRMVSTSSSPIFSPSGLCDAG